MSVHVYVCIINGTMCGACRRVLARCVHREHAHFGTHAIAPCAQCNIFAPNAHADVLTCNLSACVRLACVCARARTHGHPETCKRRQTSPRTNACAHFTHDAAPGYETICYACTKVCASKICMKCVCRDVCVRQASLAIVSWHIVCSTRNFHE